MKIGIDIRAIGRQRTGDEIYTLNLVRSLLEFGGENQYFFYTNTDNVKEIEEIKNKIDPEGKYRNYRIVPVLPSDKAFWTFWSLPKHLRKNPVDVLHVQYITPLFLPGKTKLVTTIHDVSFAALPQFIGKKDLVFLKTLIPLSFSRADKIIAVSEFTKSEIEKYYKVEGGKVERVLNGVAIEKFSKNISDEETGRVKKKYNLAKPFILYVGTLQPRKNVPFLLEAFWQLKAENKNNEKIKNLELILTGEKNGHNYDAKIDLVFERIKKADPDVSESINFIGFVEDEDLPILYKSSDCLALPSLYEGFGLPMIESMASGTPVVCSDSSCFEEISSGAALIFKQGDKNDFTKKMFDIIINNELREKLIIRGKERAQFFDWTKCASETLDIYRKLADN